MGVEGSVGVATAMAVAIAVGIDVGMDVCVASSSPPQAAIPITINTSTMEIKKRFILSPFLNLDRERKQVVLPQEKLRITPMRKDKHYSSLVTAGEY